MLSNLDMSGAKSWMSFLLIILGVLLIVRFGFGKRLIPPISQKYRNRTLPVVGAVAGFVDATGGGGWGPIAVPSLLTITDQTPRKIVGTVNTSEFLITLSAVIGFLTSSSLTGVPWAAVIGLALGGILIAPFAAKWTARVPHDSLGVLVGGLVVAVNARFVVPPSILLATLIATGIVVVSLAWLRRPRTTAAEPVTVGI